MIVVMCPRCCTRMEHRQIGVWKEHRNGYICPKCGEEAFVMPMREMRHISQYSREISGQIPPDFGI